MTTPQSDIKLGPDLGDVEGNVEGWGWVEREAIGGGRDASACERSWLHSILSAAVDGRRILSSFSFCSCSDSSLSLAFCLSL